MPTFPESSTLISLHHFSPFSKGGQRIVGLDEFRICSGQNWAVVGGNGSGKSTFGKMVAGQVKVDGEVGSYCKKLEKEVALVSFEAEHDLLEREIYEDDSEFIDQVDQGRTTWELISELAVDSVDLDHLVELLQLDAFLHTGFKILSTGERRRMMIARALSQDPGMLVLDEPYDGLDIAFTEHLKELVRQLSEQLPVVIIVNRMSHIGEQITHLACLHDMELVLQGTKQEIEESQLWRQLQGMDVELPDLPSVLEGYVAFESSVEEPIVDMRKVSVGYHNKQILSDLDWKIMPGEHWKVSGPNGSGKSTLVNLISGDHPQCYNNEMYLFGKRRGNGESIWDIKSYMGLMSTSLHQQYRVSVNVETVLLSGFFDTIGVYRRATAEHKKIAAEWLAFLQLGDALKEPFQSLSFGQQRMVLIARALIKRPYLVILDEPCQGLDPINRSLVLQLIENIAERNIAQIIYISHDEEDRLSCISGYLDFVKNDKSIEGNPGYDIQISRS